MSDPLQILSDDSVWMFPADVTLSTVELTFHHVTGSEHAELTKLLNDLYKDRPYESCLFFANGNSDVVARYLTQEEAIAGHIELEKKYGLKRCSKLKI